jgi:Spy/CpxP family protein refolding chaperone
MTRTARFPISAARLFSGAVLVAVLGTAALSVWAQGGPGRMAGHGGLGFDGGQGMGMMQGRMGERMLDSVNATAEQRAQIKQIFERNATERQAQRESHRALREQGMKLFSQPTVDATAAEALRQQMLQQHDQASRRMMQSMLEVSRVLTPEQRKLMADRMAQRGDMMRRHMQERQQLQGAPAKK